MVKWEAKYETGIGAIDSQHKELFKLVDELDTAVSRKEELDCHYLMARLEVYSLYHFTSEEHLMKKYDYPEIDEHLKEHHKFRMKVLGVKEQCMTDQSGEFRAELLKYLEDWVQQHTIELDMKYVPYFVKGLSGEG